MMYSTEAKAPSEVGTKFMVNQIPVRIWFTSTNMAKEPKKYQKLKFFGAGYCITWRFIFSINGMRYSIQLIKFLNIKLSPHLHQSKWWCHRQTYKVGSSGF